MVNTYYYYHYRSINYLDSVAYFADNFELDNMVVVCNDY